MNRGSLPEPLRILPDHAASMRPRFMNRGSGCATAPASLPDDRFNEAPIHESGKFDQRKSPAALTMLLQ